MNIESRELTASLNREGKIVMRVKLMVINKGGIHSYFMSCPVRDRHVIMLTQGCHHFLATTLPHTPITLKGSE